MPNRKSRNASKKKQQKLYSNSDRLETNKKRKIAKHQKKHPNDETVIGKKPNYAHKKEK